MKRIDFIEFLKGYAIFSIVIFHFLQILKLPSPLNQYISFGGTGVHLFVLLSGFGLYLSHLNKPLNYVSFIKKRISKIYIPYILVIVISVFVSFFLPVYPNSLYAFGGHVFLYKMFDESIVGSYGYPLWFISMSIQFYIVFIPLTFLLKKINSTYFILTGFLLSIFWITVVLFLGKETFRVWNSFFLQFIWEFIIGMVIASKFKRDNYQINFNLKPIYFLIVGILGCISYAFLAIKGGDIGKMTNDFPALVGYTSLAIWLYQINLVAINKFFIFTGKISFSIYLIHILIFNILLLFTDKISVSIIFVAALIMAYLASFYYQKIILLLYRFMKI